MTRVAVIYTGGTIGMRPGPQGLAPDTDLPSLLAPPPVPENRFELDWHTWSPLLDSSQIQPAHWQQLGREVEDRLHDHAAVLVLHGTDTMAYTASALALQLGALKGPVILTGSQRPWHEAGSDARDNWHQALVATQLPGLSEVTIAFGGRLLRGIQSHKADAASDAAFESPRHPPLALWRDHPAQPSHWQRSDAPAGWYEKRTAFHPDYRNQAVWCQQWAPGHPLIPAAQLRAMGIRVLLLTLFGTGNGPSEDPAFTGWLADLKNLGILVVGLSECEKGIIHRGAYAAGSALLNAGLLPAFGMTREAAYTKALYLCACEPAAGPERLAEQFLQNLAGEMPMR